MTNFYSQIIDGTYSARQQERDAEGQPVPVYLPERFRRNPEETATSYARRLQPVMAHLEMERPETQMAVSLAYQQVMNEVEQEQQNALATVAEGRSWLAQRTTGANVGLFGPDGQVVGRNGTRGNWSGNSVII